MISNKSFRRNRIKTVLRENKGTTMMETLVAFVVLMIILAALTRMIFFSSELRMRAMDTNRIMQTFNKEIYSNGSLDKVKMTKFTTTNETISAGKVKGPLFYITPDDREEGDPEIDLWVTDIDAYSYSYDKWDSTVNSENLAVPKALMFEHTHQND